ncbi:hypothetical protein ARMGADRAFT_472654 [Armillaria gallica]|uniref:F-box domain-containing protein n=1 Tax=Armillaria gallica TaxID=47427 RepID=A0A2H3DCX8_ARMGA|nr:hypothetical protein ARMGADRAFT_472654 [Armillaria gallica]
MTPIPPELVLEILRYLTNEFRACCLVCRAWRRLAQPIVFSSLAVSLESHCRSWNRKFVTYPHLAGYVTRLDVCGAYSVELDTVMSDEPPFLESAETLEFVRRLPNVKHLEMEGFYLSSKRAIEVLCHFTRLERLELYVMMFSQPGDLLGLMSQMVNLKDLRITGMEIRSRNKGPVGPALHNHIDAVPKRLRNLKLQDTTKSLYIFSWLSGGAFDLDNLTDLTLTWEYFPTRHRRIEIQFPTTPQLSSYLDPFIKTAGTAIKHLRLEIEALDYDFKSYANSMQAHFISTGAMSGFTALEETLDIDSINLYFKNDAAHLVDVERLLHSVTLTNLRKIRITMSFTLNTPDHLPSYEEVPSWTSLDGLFSSPKFPSLQQLKLIIEVRSNDWYDPRWEDSGSDEEHAPDFDFHHRL